MGPRILLVDDEVNVLQGYTRNLRRRFQLDTATNGRDAIEALDTRGPFAVIVSDMRMPGMDGAELLARARERHPDTVRIMLTGNADRDTAIEAVNRGAIFRFLTKPCDAELLATVLDAATAQYRLVSAERELLERTLKGAVLMLGELLSMLDPASFGRSEQLGTLAMRIAPEMHMEQAWILEVAAVLSQIGIHTLPPSVIEKIRSGAFLGTVEREMYSSIPEIGANLIRCIPRLDEVASIVYYLQKNYNGTGFPNDDVRGDLIPLGARILRAAQDFLTLSEQKPSAREVLRDMQTRQAWYDPKVLQALETVLESQEGMETPPEPQQVTLAELKVGQILADGVSTTNGWLVLPAGSRLGRTHLEKIRNFARLVGIREPLAIYP